ncbi:MAG: PQQ-binding-like beta-propeller repeat protein [Planctomycetota bacterium]
MRLAVCVTILLLLTGQSLVAQDWPQWRGPSGDNHAADDAIAPVEWSNNQNLVWSVAVPGRGHSSPTVVNDRIYLTTADKSGQTQSLLIFNRQTGELITNTVVHQGGLTATLHPNNTHASPTVASDGQRVFALFNNGEAAWVTAFDLDGNRLWQQRAIGFDPKQYEFGFGSSPVYVGGLIVVASEYDGPESGIVALDAATGKPRWKIARPQSLSYSTPALAVQNGQRYLVTSGNNSFTAYTPQSGQSLWSVEGSTFATCGTMVWSDRHGLVFASGGYPETFTSAVRADGSQVAWTNNKIKCYEQSMLVVGDYLYAVTDRGLVHCLRVTDGQEIWKQRLGGGFSSSPLLVDGKIYVTNERGTTFVFAASPEGYQRLGENQLGTDCFATPTPVGNRLYHRFAIGSGTERQEYLVAIGK